MEEQEKETEGELELVCKMIFFLIKILLKGTLLLQFGLCYRSSWEKILTMIPKTKRKSRESSPMIRDSTLDDKDMCNRFHSL